MEKIIDGQTREQMAKILDVPTNEGGVQYIENYDDNNWYIEVKKSWLIISSIVISIMFAIIWWIVSSSERDETINQLVKERDNLRTNLIQEIKMDVKFKANVERKEELKTLEKETEAINKELKKRYWGLSENDFNSIMK